MKPDGWDRFYAKYPNSPKIITISRVGFNQRGDVAMVYVGEQRHWLAGGGQICVLRKQKGKWMLTPAMIGSVWISVAPERLAWRDAVITKTRDNQSLLWPDFRRAYVNLLCGRLKHLYSNGLDMSGTLMLRAGKCGYEIDS